MKERKLTKQELIAHLNDQLISIRAFCKLYDSGDKGIAKELAVKFRVLFHNTDKSHSLLRQLKLENIKFIVQSLTYDVNYINTHVGLCGIRHFIEPNGDTQFWPIGPITQGRLLSFDSWWTNEKILVTKDRQKTRIAPDKTIICKELDSFTRKKLILAIANNDGGAHVAIGLPTNYDRIKNHFEFGINFQSQSTSEAFVLEPIRPTIRQIATEVLTTFDSLDISAESKLH